MMEEKMEEKPSSNEKGVCRKQEEEVSANKRVFFVYILRIYALAEDRGRVYEYMSRQYTCRIKQSESGETILTVIVKADIDAKNVCGGRDRSEP
jgi:hypothetical protein